VFGKTSSVRAIETNPESERTPAASKTASRGRERAKEMSNERKKKRSTTDDSVKGQCLKEKALEAFWQQLKTWSV